MYLLRVSYLMKSRLYSLSVPLYLQVLLNFIFSSHLVIVSQIARQNRESLLPIPRQQFRKRLVKIHFYKVFKNNICECVILHDMRDFSLV